jgi:transposase
MAVTDGAGATSAPATWNLLRHMKSGAPEQTLLARFTNERPRKLIGDKAYDSDPLDKKLAEFETELIAPHKVNRKKVKTQDARKLRRYKRRWKIERLFAWLQNFRRVLIRFDYYDANYLGFVHPACIVILLRNYF